MVNKPIDERRFSMNSAWSTKWKKILIWFSAYTSYIAFALVGGYVIVKNEDEELKKTAKVSLVVTLIFAAFSAFLSIFYNFASMSSTYYGSGAYDFHDYATKFVNVAKIAVYAIFIIVELVKKENVKKNEYDDDISSVEDGTSDTEV